MTTKNKNLLKASAVSVLALFLFSIGFIIFSSGALSARIGNAEALPNGTQDNDVLKTSSNSEESEIVFAEEVIATFTIPAQQATADNFITPSLDVVELRAARGTRGVEFDELWAISDDERTPEALSAEEAALLGAKYIWDILGVSIDGTTVEMQYGQWNGYASALWEGKVMVPEEERVDGDMWFSYLFLLDAVTGERREIQSWNRACSEWATGPEARALLHSKGDDHITHEAFWDSAFALAVSLPETEELMKQTGKIFAERHFENSEVVDIYLGGSGIVLDKNEAGEVVVILNYFSVSAVDNEGRKIDLHFEISSESELIFMMLQPNHNNPNAG